MYSKEIREKLHEKKAEERRAAAEKARGEAADNEKAQEVRKQIRKQVKVSEKVEKLLEALSVDGANTSRDEEDIRTTTSEPLWLWRENNYPEGEDGGKSDVYVEIFVGKRLKPVERKLGIVLGGAGKQEPGETTSFGVRIFAVDVTDPELAQTVLFKPASLRVDSHRKLLAKDDGSEVAAGEPNINIKNVLEIEDALGIIRERVGDHAGLPVAEINRQNQREDLPPTAVIPL